MWPIFVGSGGIRKDDRYQESIQHLAAEGASAYRAGVEGKTEQRQRAEWNYAILSIVSKDLYILAGANGSGKSTIAKVLLPREGIVYINPDDIAREINPDDPVGALLQWRE